MFIMNNEDNERYLQLLGQELQKQNITGEILISGDVIVLLDIRQPNIHSTSILATVPLDSSLSS